MIYQRRYVGMLWTGKSYAFLPDPFVLLKARVHSADRCSRIVHVRRTANDVTQAWELHVSAGSF